MVERLAGLGEEEVKKLGSLSLTDRQPRSIDDQSTIDWHTYHYDRSRHRPLTIDHDRPTLVCAPLYPYISLFNKFIEPITP